MNAMAPNAALLPESFTSASMKCRVAGGWWWLPWLAAVAVFAGVEGSRADRQPTLAAWFWQAEFDALVYLGFLVAAPILWWLQRMEVIGEFGFPRVLTRPAHALCGAPGAPARAFDLRSAMLSAFVGTVSLVVSAGIGSHFDDLPPAYHDEYSYLFQAETFLVGRVSFPSHPAARLFDQMHVLNEGRFASRYFPGAGLWMAPFVAAGHPYWGHWLAGAIFSVLMFWIARELAGNAGGLIAGLLTALSPGMALFSNLLLAHHPTLVGLSVFLFGYLKLIRSGATAWGLLSGTGLAFAMLCRPMTAAGVALPFGIFLLIWALRARRSIAGPMLTDAGRVGDVADAATIGVTSVAHDNNGPPTIRRWQAILRMGLPLLAAGAGLFIYDKAITGSGWLTPYSLYTDLHTPRHVYGFNNVERGNLRQGPRVITNYDQWAENLTPRRALANARTRLVASWKWTLGLIPLTLAVAGGIILRKHIPREAWLIVAGIVSLHAVHIPYWFVGMEDHHYVFEAGPLWCVWVGVVTTAAFRAWQAERRGALCVWWSALLTAAVAMNFTISGGTWSAPLEQGINRVAFARAEHGRFLALAASRAVPLPALVLVDSDPADRHIDYVANSPDLSAQLLIGRYLPEVVPVDEVRRLFPNRSVFIYRIRNVFRNGVRVPEDEWRRVDTNP